MRGWPSQVQIVHCETSAMRELAERIKVSYELVKRYIEIVIPWVWADSTG